MDSLTAIAVFLAYIVIDALYALYTHAIANERSALAATTGAIMYVLMAYGIKSVVDSFWYVIPLMAGSWIGTYATIELLKSKKVAKEQ